MILTRTAVKTIQPLRWLLTSCGNKLLRNSFSPCCTTITRRGYATRWHGQPNEVFDDSQSDFKGYWVETMHADFKDALKAAGVQETDIGHLETTMTWMSYDRIGQTWEYAYGHMNSPTSHNCTFKFGEIIDYYFYNGQKMKGVVYPDGNILREMFESITSPKFIFIAEKKIAVSKPNEMNVTIQVNNAITTKVYERKLGQEDAH